MNSRRQVAQRPIPIKRPARAPLHRAIQPTQHRLAVRLKLEGQLRRAVEAPEGITQLRLLFDPLVSLRDRNTVGMEALVAWQHREQGLLRAAEFVPLAEETGLISAIGHWVLGEACQTARRVNRSRRDDPLFMSVNLSGHELNNPDVVTWVTKEIARADIDPTRLWLEITETALVSSPSIRSTLWRLRFSRTTDSMPSRWSRCESSSPAGPAPTIPTCVRTGPSSS